MATLAGRADPAPARPTRAKGFCCQASGRTSVTAMMTPASPAFLIRSFDIDSSRVSYLSGGGAMTNASTSAICF